jgi:hypothetical protein
MKNNRREFIKMAGMAGAALVVGPGQAKSNIPYREKHQQRFNMHGYAAPKLDRVRIGFIGVGSRGSGTVRRMARVEGVDIKAVCDIVPQRVSDTIESIKKYSQHPDSYTENEDAWKQLCDREDIDLVIISTPWKLHTPQAVYAMEQGKHAATEVPAATTIEDCWKLVETSERTRKHCMMLANSAYGDFQILTLNMARQGFFGEIIHGEGAYIHDRVSGDNRWVRDENNNNWFGYRPWRLDENSKRNGNLYPTHGLGTICQVMDLNYGDQMDYLVSVSSNDFTMGEKMKELAATDDFYKPYANMDFRGNMNTTTIRTRNGRTIMLQHDISSPRPNVRFNLISGTKAIAQQYPLPPKIATSHEGWLSQEEFNQVEEKYTPEISKRIGNIAKDIGGHGGVDTMLVWRLVDCLRNGIPLDMDVYDAALWSCIAPLSEWSVANRSNSIEVPDFTSGAWETNERGMDIALEKGGTTQLI